MQKRLGSRRLSISDVFSGTAVLRTDDKLMITMLDNESTETRS